jgi:hypothetical protein
MNHHRKYLTKIITAISPQLEIPDLRYKSTEKSFLISHTKLHPTRNAIHSLASYPPRTLTIYYDETPSPAEIRIYISRTQQNNNKATRTQLAESTEIDWQHTIPYDPTNHTSLVEAIHQVLKTASDLLKEVDINLKILPMLSSLETLTPTKSA